MERMIELLRAERKARQQSVPDKEKERLTKERKYLIESELRKKNDFCIKSGSLLERIRRRRKFRKKGN